MKLSQMTTDQLADALCKLAMPVKNLCDDPDFAEAFTSFRNGYKQGGALAVHVGLFYTKFAPLMLRTHKQDLYEVVSIMTGKTIEVVAAQSALQTIRDVTEFVDKDFLDFFTLPGAVSREK